MGECRLVTFCCLEVVTLRRALGIHLGVHYQHERMNRDVFLNAPGESHAQANSQRETIRPAGVAIRPPMPHRMSPSSISRALRPALTCCVGVNPFATISRSDVQSGTVSSSAVGMRI
jgi:hypothetical protein